VAWFGASAVYHSSGPAMPQQNIKVDPKKRRVAVNDINWQLEHAREARSVVPYASSLLLNRVYLTS
jgi:chromatin structure-remodeling complex protein RSC7